MQARSELPTRSLAATPRRMHRISSHLQAAQGPVGTGVGDRPGRPQGAASFLVPLAPASLLPGAARAWLQPSSPPCARNLRQTRTAKRCDPTSDCLRAPNLSQQPSAPLAHDRWRPYRVECTGSLPTSEVKRRRARLVLGWGTAREDLRVLPAFRFEHGSVGHGTRLLSANAGAPRVPGRWPHKRNHNPTQLTEGDSLAWRLLARRAAHARSQERAPKRSRWRPYRVECTGSLPTSEVKRRRARFLFRPPKLSGAGPG